jgi:hypothetical protein
VTKGSRFLGGFALAFFLIQAGVHTARGKPGHVLWVCTVGVAAIAIGQLAGVRMLNAIGTFWLTVGLPTWLFDLANGGEFIPTSMLTHVGGLLIGYTGMARLGLPERTWWVSILGMAGLLIVSRLVTPPELNVNLVFSTYGGTSHIVSSHFWNLAIVMAIFTAVFMLLQFGLPRTRLVRS